MHDTLFLTILSERSDGDISREKYKLIAIIRDTNQILWDTSIIETTSKGDWNLVELPLPTSSYLKFTRLVYGPAVKLPVKLGQELKGRQKTI